MNLIVRNNRIYNRDIRCTQRLLGLGPPSSDRIGGSLTPGLRCNRYLAAELVASPLLRLGVWTWLVGSMLYELYFLIFTLYGFRTAFAKLIRTVVFS